MIRSFLIRATGAVLLGGIGVAASVVFTDLFDQSTDLLWAGVFGGVGALVGLLMARYIILIPFRFCFSTMANVSNPTVSLGILGFLMGLVIAALLSFSFRLIPGSLGWIIPIGLSSTLGPIGALVMILKFHKSSSLSSGIQDIVRLSRPTGYVSLIDTSSIIDGRIADLIPTGFLQGTLGVPRFILEELQHIADSNDSMRRSRGRRGLEVLHRLRTEGHISMQVLEKDYDQILEVDAKLVKLAKEINASLITTDFNLNRIADFEGVRVLNINELANVLKPSVSHGDDMTIRVIQEGRESGQGVGFLDDGTMVVIEGGKRFLNSYLSVSVTRVLQTNAGRIIFGQPKGD